MRDMLAEHRLHPSDLILPLFVCEGQGCEEPIASLRGVSRWSVDRLTGQAQGGGIARHSLRRIVSEHARSTFAPTTRAKRSTAKI